MQLTLIWGSPILTLTCRGLNIADRPRVLVHRGRRFRPFHKGIVVEGSNVIQRHRVLRLNGMAGSWSLPDRPRKITRQCLNRCRSCLLQARGILLNGSQWGVGGCSFLQKCLFGLSSELLICVYPPAYLTIFVNVRQMPSSGKVAARDFCGNVRLRTFSRVRGAVKSLELPPRITCRNDELSSQL